MRRDENRNSFNCSGHILLTLRSNSVSDKLTSAFPFFLFFLFFFYFFFCLYSCSLPLTMLEEHWAKAAWDKDGLGGAASNCASNSETFDLRWSFCWLLLCSLYFSFFISRLDRLDRSIAAKTYGTYATAFDFNLRAWWRGRVVVLDGMAAITTPRARCGVGVGTACACFTACRRGFKK
jgi:hypothetical protein